VGLDLHIISNNSSHRRIERVCNQIDVTGIHFALKPFTFNMTQYCKEATINYDECAIIGDQIFTDIISGNWLKMHTILIHPTKNKLSFIKRFQHHIEQLVLEKIT